MTINGQPESDTIAVAWLQTGRCATRSRLEGKTAGMRAAKMGVEC